jgi:hypothetical protein
MLASWNNWRAAAAGAVGGRNAQEDSGASGAA